MSRYTRTPITSGFEVQSQLNQNFTDIQEAIDDTLSRVGDSPNQLESDLDFNSFRAYNLPAPSTATEPLRLADLPLLDFSQASLPSVSGATAGKVLGNDGSSLSWFDTSRVVSSVSSLKAISVTSVVDGAIFMTRGYSTSGVGSAFYRYNSGSSATADNVLVIQPNSGSGRWELLYDDSIFVEWAGAIGDGSTDDQAAIVSAISVAITLASSTSPAKVKFRPKKYKCNSYLGTFTSSNLTIDFNGAVLDFSGVSSAGYALTISGSLGAYTNLTNAAAEGQQYVLVANTAGYAYGDWLKIVSNEIWDASSTSTKYGEINKIPDAVNSTTALPTTRIYLSTPLQTRANVATYLAKLAKISMADNIRIENGTFLGYSGLQDSTVGIRLDYCSNVVISNMKMQDFDDRFIYAKDCALMSVSNCSFYRSRPVALGYGVSFVDASQDCVVSNCSFDGVRHALSTNNNVSTDFGVARRIKFVNNNVTYSAKSSVTSSTFTADAGTDQITMATPSATFSSTSTQIRLTTTGTLPAGTDVSTIYWVKEVVANTVYTLHPTRADAIAGTNTINITDTGSGTHTATAYPGGDAVDTHTGADYITISGNSIVGASGSGINVECPNAIVSNNTIIAPYAYGIYWHNESDKTGQVVISDNRIDYSSGSGILASQGANGTSTEMRGVVISNNLVRFPGVIDNGYAYKDGVTYLGSTGVTQDGSLISGNVITSPAGRGFYIEETNGMSIVGNSVFNGSVEGIRLYDALKTSVVANNVQLASTAASNGIMVVSSASGESNYVVLSDNVVTSVTGTVTGSGISVDSNSTNITVSDTNQIQGFSTTKTVSSGTGTKVFYTGSATYDPPSLADGVGATTTVTATGCALGDSAVATFSLDLQGITLTAWVSAANTVSVRFQNESGGVLDLASGTLKVKTERF